MVARLTLHPQDTFFKTQNEKQIVCADKERGAK
jgi:hypothetical protein